MDLLWIVDPLESLKPKKDSSIAMMRAAAQQGDRIWTTTVDSLQANGFSVSALAMPLEMVDELDWYRDGIPVRRLLSDFDAVIMRKDPPFDIEYVWALMLLERAEMSGARILNQPAAVRSHGEKLAILEFSEFIAPTRVARSMQAVQDFIDDYSDVIVKPLDGMGGAGIFRIRYDDPNRNALVETVTGFGQRFAMVQMYLPAISEGDKRILLIAGQPVPYALARIPKEGESRGNLAAGGRGVAMPLSERERLIAETLGPILFERGLFLVGLDVIGGYLTEINVTSPTCFVEITEQTDFDVAQHFMHTLSMLKA